MALILTGTSSTTTLDSSAGLTFSDSSNQAAAASPFGLKNRIINGDMVIDQRNGGAATANTINGYTIDRWVVNQSVTGKLIAQQNAGSVTPPAGFTNYLGVTSQSSYSVLTSDFYAIGQVIEGFNVADLAWGTANAQTITLSFWVRSSLTGTFGGAIQNSAQSRSYPFTYTISSANTWEKETITIPGDTSGTWLTNNSAGLRLFIGLGAGSTYSGTAGSWSANNFWSATGAVSVVGTNGATFYLTGVQLERNTTATPFEWIPYGTELALCYRYYQQLNFNIDIGANGMGLVATKYSATDSAIANAQLLAPMRTTPTITKSQSTARFVSSGGVATVTGVAAGTYGLNGPIWVVGTNNSLAAGSNGWFDSIGSIYISAEL
jgi:hypothetical protein